MSDSLERMRRGNPVKDVVAPPIEPLLARLAVVEDGSAPAPAPLPAGTRPAPAPLRDGTRLAPAPPRDGTRLAPAPPRDGTRPATAPPRDDVPPPPARPPSPRAGQRRGLHRPAVLGLALLLLIAAVAVAATGILVGDPIKPRDGVTFTPSRGLGVAQPGSDKLFALRVPDPDGGPPWGLRLLTTTRGLGCLQLGRVVDGRLGVLGRDGAFAGDGRFHELPPTVLDQANCTLLDGRRQTFLAVSVQGLPASAMPGGCTAAPQAARPPGMAPIANPLPVCDPASLRILYYGTLGPRARRVSYDGPDSVRRSATVEGSAGAYLVVLKPAPGAHPDGHWGSTYSPASGLKSVRYADGHVCHVRSPQLLGGAKPCPPVGYVAPRRPRVTSRQVAAPLRVRLSPAARGRLRLSISFTARVAVRSGNSSYQLMTAFPRSRGCDTGATGARVFDDIAVGERVTMAFDVQPGCPGMLRGSVVFVYNTPLSSMPFIGIPFTKGHPVVGRFAVRIPR